MRHNALDQARREAMLTLDRNLAIHAYFTHQLKPKVFEAFQAATPSGYFDPSWMSSTYAVRKIDKYYAGIAKDRDRYYKECAINARSPVNEAAGYERAFIQQLNQDPTLQAMDTVKTVAGRPYYVVLRRGEVVGATCLRCHSTPQAAPAGLVGRYGPERGFGRRQGEVVSAISIRVPLAAAYARADRVAFYLSLGLGLLLLGLLATLAGLNRAMFANPLRILRDSAARISRDDPPRGDITTDLPGEWRDLALEFNKLLARLREHHQQLEQKVAERTAKLARLEEHFRVAFETSPDAININRLEDGLYVDINEGFTRLTGYTREDVIGKTSLELDIWCDPADRAKMVAGLAKDGYYENLEARFRRKDGNTLAGLMSSKTIMIDGEPHLLNITRDISAIKAAQDELARQRGQLLSIFNSMAAMVEIVDLETHEIVFMNQYGKSLLGYDPVGLKCHKVMQGRAGPCPHCNNQRLLSEPERRDQVEYYSAVLEKHMLSNNQTIPWDDGRAVKLAVSFDITDRKATEAERDRLKDQLRQAQKMEAVGSLAGGVAHDLNNLLSPIIGFSELLMDELEGETDRRDSVHQILEAGLRARDLVRQLLAFGRKQALKMRPLDLGEAVRGVEKLLRRTIREDVDMKFSLPPGLPAVRADLGQLEQVIMNLAVNAQEAMPSGGRLAIEAGLAELDEHYCRANSGVKPGPYVVLSVSDTGQGMDQSTRRRVFEPFFTTKDKEGGTGLGLATVYGIVKQHGGHISVYSEPGQGAAFKVYLPVAQGSTAPAAAERRQASSAGGSETILLAEDNDMVRDLAQQVLRRLGYTVLAADCGRRALELLAEHDGPVDMVLTDVVMPEMNGKELYDRVSQSHPEAKVLFMSGYTDNVIAHHGSLEEGVSFIQKPFSVHNLAAKVREVLDNQGDG